MKQHLFKTAMLGTALLFANAEIKAQQRYVHDIFTSVVKRSNVEYDSNRTVNILYGQIPGMQPIITQKYYCDVYMPAADGNTKRPTIIVAGTGSYLPTIINNQTTGSKDDSSIVELCTRFAKKGYTAVAMNYRQGWNPQTTVQATATEQLIQATYRAIQDMRNCVRFMRLNADTFGVDTSKFIVGGQGTGGYVVYGMATVDRRAEIESNLKFLRGDATPMVNMDTLGDWNGSGGISYFNYAGEAGVSGDIDMMFNYGGAMGDLAWLEAGGIPMVSLHAITDPFAPFGTGNVVVPTTGVTVIPNAAGGGSVIPKANTVGVNNKLNATDFHDVYTVAAMKSSGNVKNLFALHATPYDGAPWEWWDRPTVQAIVSQPVYGFPIPANGHKADSLSMLTNPTMSAAKGRAYIDTVVNFVAPRIAAQFDLAVFTRIDEQVSLSEQLNVFPNPSHGAIQVSMQNMDISNIAVRDITGRTMLTANSLNTHAVTLQDHNLNAGIYFIHVGFANGRSAMKKIVVE